MPRLSGCQVARGRRDPEAAGKRRSSGRKEGEGREDCVDVNLVPTGSKGLRRMGAAYGKKVSLICHWVLVGPESDQTLNSLVSDPAPNCQMMTCVGKL